MDEEEEVLERAYERIRSYHVFQIATRYRYPFSVSYWKDGHLVAIKMKRKEWREVKRFLVRLEEIERKRRDREFTAMLARHS